MIVIERPLSCLSYDRQITSSKWGVFRFPFRVSYCVLTSLFFFCSFDFHVIYYVGGGGGGWSKFYSLEINKFYSYRRGNKLLEN